MRFDFRANFSFYWYLLWSSFVSEASLKYFKFLLITTRIKTFTSFIPEYWTVIYEIENL